LTEGANQVIDARLARETNKLELIRNPDFNDEHAYPVLSDQTGYIQLINFEMMFQELAEKDVTVLLQINEGDFIVQGEQIGKVINRQESKEDADVEDKEIMTIINSNVAIGNERNDIYDYRFALQKVQEIALRALSASVSDPYTGIECIYALGNLFQKLAVWNSGYYIMKQDDRPITLYYKSNSLNEDLILFFHSIVKLGCDDFLVLNALFDAYKDIAAVSSEESLDAVVEIADYTFAQAKQEFKHDTDIKIIENKYKNFCNFVERQKNK